MSGPKVDVAEIRNQEREKLAKAREARKNLSKSIRENINKINDSISKNCDLMMQDESLRPLCDRLRASQEKCIKELENILVQLKMGNEMQNINELSRKSQKLISDFNKDIKNDTATLDERIKSSQNIKEVEANRHKLSQIKKKNIARLTETDVIPENEVTDADIAELAEAVDKEITEFMSIENMTSKHKNTMLLINQDLKDILNSGISNDRKEKRIKRLFADFEKMSGLAKSDVEEMKYMYEEYIKECFDSTFEPASFSDFSTKKEIEDAILNVKENAERNMSKEYIKRQIDEVMTKHGYDVLHSDMLTEATQNGQILYGVDNDTAINVFVSDENQVTMRVVGVGFDTDISESEDERLYKQQCAFCSMHPQITAELAMRGVIFHEKKHLPPDKKYNKKLQVNTKNNNQTTGRAKKELKRTGLKTMRKGE